MDAAMRLHFHQPDAAHRRERTRAQTGSERASAEGLLGSAHPLVTLLRRYDTIFEQALAVTAAQAAGMVFALGSYGFGLWVAIAAGVVQLALGWRLALLGMSRREVCVGLLVEGRTGLGLPCVERERRRLLDPRKAGRLADSIEDIVRTAAHPPTTPALARPLFDVRLIRAVVPELREIAGLLRGDCPWLQGVAVVERLLTATATPLYGNEVERLRQELRRARYLLSVKK